LPTLLKKIAAPVGGLALVADSMCQRHLGNFERVPGALGSPIAEARPETMHRQVTAFHAPQQDQHRHIAERLPGPTRKMKSPLRLWCNFSRIAIDARQRHAVLPSHLHALIAALRNRFRPIGHQ
jgi:hypothetical protein